MFDNTDPRQGNNVSSIIDPVELSFLQRLLREDPIKDAVEVLLCHSLLITEILCVQKQLI